FIYTFFPYPTLFRSLSQWFKSFVIETPLPYVCFLPSKITPDFYPEFLLSKITPTFTVSFTARNYHSFLPRFFYPQNYPVFLFDRSEEHTSELQSRFD